MLRPTEDLLRSFLSERLRELDELDPTLRAVGDEVLALVRAGGKRLRPAFVHWGAAAAGADTDAVRPVAAAMELLHSFALIHDDVMDRAARRRGRPSAQAAFARRHLDERLLGDPGWFGVSAAILAGDLAFVWADELLERTGLHPEAMAQVRRIFTRLRTEVTAGQYLDLRLAGTPGATTEEALRVALLKSGRYSVTRPLLLGAAAGEPGPATREALRAYGDAVGISFQLRDDVIGLFGDPATSGKDVVGDLREGKRTLLILHALELATDTGRARLRSVLGAEVIGPPDLAAVREVVVTSGALAEVESRIASGLGRALEALAGVPEPAGAALAELAHLATRRSR